MATGPSSFPLYAKYYFYFIEKEQIPGTQFTLLTKVYPSVLAL